ncbi:SseB family protein [Weissella cibaria]|uniref:SseB family protein n=1 Tax=Weissella cibaria TaxID=137591 RepID=UPI00118F7CD8|nr:SseB family protein [Weissella cibaria]MCS8561306.1 hypothetical protein [Weissella cibaria]MCS8566029.1 hypothetical protein [Weissella cibaria]MCS8576953.1 hypothetical protein [Weissella cibaria]TVV37642.1 hypothetical protein FO437_02595 [Weissella cibaria]
MMKRLFLNLTLTNPRLEKEIRETIIAQSNRSQRRERQDIYPLLEKSWLLAPIAVPQSQLRVLYSGYQVAIGQTANYPLSLLLEKAGQTYVQLYSSTAKYEASAQDLPTVWVRATVIFDALEQTPEVAGLLLNDGTDELMVSRDELQRQFPRHELARLRAPWYERQLATDFPKRLPVPGGNEAWQTRQKEIDQISNALEELRAKTEKKARRAAKGSSLHQLTVGLLVVALIVLMRLGRHALLPMGVLLFLALASAVYGYRHPRGRTLGRWLVYEKRGGLAKMLQMEDELYRLSAKVTTTKPVPDQSETRKSEMEPEQITPVPDQHPETVSDEEMTGFFTAYLAARRERKDVSQHYDDFLTVARYYRFSIPKQVDGKLAIYYYADQDYLPLYIAPTEAMAPFGTRQVTGQQALALVAQLDVVGVQIRANNQRIMLPTDILQKRWGEEA